MSLLGNLQIPKYEATLIDHILKIFAVYIRKPKPKIYFKGTFFFLKENNVRENGQWYELVILSIHIKPQTHERNQFSSHREQKLKATQEFTTTYQKTNVTPDNNKVKEGLGGAQSPMLYSESSSQCVT